MTDAAPVHTAEDLKNNSPQRHRRLYPYSRLCLCGEIFLILL
jgi:hypothetical protein